VLAMSGRGIKESRSLKKKKQRPHWGGKCPLKEHGSRKPAYPLVLKFKATKSRDWVFKRKETRGEKHIAI